MGLCDNKEDLKWCQNGQRKLTSVPLENEGLPNENSWKPLEGSSECPLPNSKLNQIERFTETKVLKPHANKLLSSRQQIDTRGIEDGRAYHCLNRGDETPFRKNAGEKIEKTWNELMNEPCAEDKRRCMGKGVKEECVHVHSKQPYHTAYSCNIMCQKWEGDGGLRVPNEIIFKKYAESLKSWEPFGSCLDFIKNPQTTFSLPLLTHDISTIGGVSRQQHQLV